MNTLKYGIPKDYCIIAILPDGINFFQGVHEIPINPMTRMTAKANIWHIDYNQLGPDTGFFDYKRAKEWLPIIGMEGVKIMHKKDALKEWNLQNKLKQKA